MIIDSHQHFWYYQAEKHSWIDDDMAIIRKDFLPKDLKKVYKENHIDGCVAIQADQSFTETIFLNDLANEHKFIRGVVGWIDLRERNVENTLGKFNSANKIKGFRHVVQDEADPNFLLREDFKNGIRLISSMNYTYDILVFPHQLGAVLEFVKHFPEARFVIDHGAKPYIKDGFFDGWSLLMREIAQFENVYCKVSGLITEADFKNWTPYQIDPYLEVIFEAFGSQRTMFGSDWPVCLVAGNYATVKKLITDYISSFSTTEQKAIMGENAIKFYNL